MTWDQERHDAARARCDAATTGPWIKVDDYPDGPYLCPPATGAMLVDYGQDVHQQLRDASFIAHARLDLPAALDEIERLLAITTEEQA